MWKDSLSFPSIRLICSNKEQGMEWEWKYHKHFVLALYTKQNEIETEGDCNDDDDDDDDDDEDSDIMALFTGMSSRSDSVRTKKSHYPGG